jgi:uncharacterized protein (DUF2267 family)
MRQLSTEALADLVEDRCGASRPASERAVQAVLEALGDALPRSAQAHVARVVQGAAPALAAGLGGSARTLDDLIARVSEVANQSPSEALEELDVVCAAIAEAWTDEDRRVVLSDLEPDMRPLFDEKPRAAPLPQHPARAGRKVEAAPKEGARRALSTGRPGAVHPLATAAPEPARDADHERTKLSTGAPSLERAGQTLARGRTR